MPKSNWQQKIEILSLWLCGLAILCFFMAALLRNRIMLLVSFFSGIILALLYAFFHEETPEEARRDELERRERREREIRKEIKREEREQQQDEWKHLYG